MRRAKNRFDVQVSFPDFSFSVKNRTDVEITVDDVLRSLEEFCERIRNAGKVPSPIAPVDAQPAADPPRCPSCHCVMCEQFDDTPILMRPRGRMATPNGTYRCYHCDRIAAKTAKATP